MKHGKEVIRSLVHKGVADGRLHPGEHRSGRASEPTLCERCGAAFARRVWHRSPERPSHALLASAHWTICPACTQVEREEYMGRVTLDASALPEDVGSIRRRIGNVVRRAGHTNAQRRVVSISQSGDALVVLTTSQKLAHRIVHEVKKAFGGRAAYRWNDDGSLEARWSAPSKARRSPRTHPTARGAGGTSHAKPAATRRRYLAVVQIFVALAASLALAGLAAAAGADMAVELGKSEYMRYCATCHGPSATGEDGVASRLFTKRPTNLTLLAKDNGGKFPMMKLITVVKGEEPVAAHGTREMPVWGVMLGESDGKGGPDTANLRIVNIGKYLETIQVGAR